MAQLGTQEEGIFAEFKSQYGVYSPPEGLVDGTTDEFIVADDNELAVTIEGGDFGEYEDTLAAITATPDSIAWTSKDDHNVLAVELGEDTLYYDKRNVDRALALLDLNREDLAPNHLRVHPPRSKYTSAPKFPMTLSDPVSDILFMVPPHHEE